MSCNDCLNRREFLAKSTLAAAALAVVEACGDGQFGPTGSTGTPVLTTPLSVTVANFPGLATTGQPVVVGPSIALVRTGATTFAAFSTLCTHEGCDTAVEKTQFHCPCHDSLFSSSGAVLRGPATRPLDALKATYDVTSNTVTIS